MQYTHFPKATISFVMTVRPSVRTHGITRPPIGQIWKKRNLFV